MAPVLLFINPQVSDSPRSRDARFAKKVVAERLYLSSERIWDSLVPRNTDVKPGMGCRVREALGQVWLRSIFLGLASGDAVSQASL